MKIEFDTDINGYHEIRKFEMLLENYIHSRTADPSVISLAEALQNQLQVILDHPEFRQLKNENPDQQAFSDLAAESQGILSRARSFLHMLLGPGRRELLLSKQRQELIERAEHAELSAFSALAETAEVGRQRDDALQKLNQLEAELEKLKASINKPD